jgi:hypothetical protein
MPQILRDRRDRKCRLAAAGGPWELRLPSTVWLTFGHTLCLEVVAGSSGHTLPMPAAKKMAAVTKLGLDRTVPSELSSSTEDSSWSCQVLLGMRGPLEYAERSCGLDSFDVMSRRWASQESAYDSHMTTTT